MKRYLQLIILALLPMCAWAEGQWTLHQVYLDNEFQNIADLGDKVYYLDNGALYQFDKQSHDIVKLDKNNLLTDQTITHMYFNAEKDFILLVYDNSNMDFLYSDGTIRNYSAINDAIISWSKVVNDVTFVDHVGLSRPPEQFQASGNRRCRWCHHPARRHKVCPHHTGPERCLGR